ncbi:MAG: hypothetical protein L6R39_005874 [Caloplaca ligustica]|nr:MAG: hypothetical protein L6R39_005874 [Caloplaca ligustica]
MSSPLADVFGELILFCMDYSVWQSSGSHVYRLHDDFWLWGSAPSCIQSWQAMNDYATVMGLQFNTEKTGCVHVSRTGPNPSLQDLLPHGDVRYGFLKLLPNAHFTIDRSLVDKHIEKLVAQLASSKSIFMWIRTWNMYGMGFFTSMVGGAQPANCFGAQHIAKVQSMFSYVCARVFRDEANVTNHLRKRIKERFPWFTHSLVDAFMFLPIEFGGLGVQNPFVSLALLNGRFAGDPESPMTDFFKAESTAYATAQASYERACAILLRNPEQRPLEAFLSLSEYTGRREHTSRELLEAYQTLLKRPGPDRLRLSKEIVAMLGGTQAVENYSRYNLWLLEQYRQELVENFGGLRIIDTKLLPMGTIKLARKQRIKWRV